MEKMDPFKKILSIGILLWIPSGISHAKSWSEAATDKITLKVGFVTPSLNSEFKPDNNSPNKVIFQPSSPTKFSLGVGYGPFSASYGFPGATSDKEKVEKGESKIVDWQLRFFGDVHTFDLFYQKYTGYHVQNTTEIDPSATSNFIRPDLSNEHYGFQYFYNFHPDDVSIRAAFDQSSLQNKSGGGGLLVASVNHIKIAADSAILPAGVSSQYGQFANLKGGVFNSFKIGLGGAYTWVWSHWFASGLLTVGFGPQTQTFDVGTGESLKASKTVSGANLKVGLGYNSKKFFTALGLFIDSQNIENNSLYITNSTVEGSIWLGARF